MHNYRRGIEMVRPPTVGDSIEEKASPKVSHLTMHWTIELTD